MVLKSARSITVDNNSVKYAIIEFLGAVAQLGEHCVRIAGVRGSNPLSSSFHLMNFSIQKLS